MQEGSGVPNLKTELNYLDSFKTYCNFSDLGFLGSGGGAGGWGCLGNLSRAMISGGCPSGGIRDNRKVS